MTGYRAGGPHGLNACDWTDDTSMALAPADSPATVGWNLNDQADRYLSWYRAGEYSGNGRCFDIGNVTREVLDRYAETGDASTSDPDHEHSAGNGSIMRLAPVPMFFADLCPERAVDLIWNGHNSSLPTHRAPQAVSACAYSRWCWPP